MATETGGTYPTVMHSRYRPQTKLWKGNVFTSVCQEFCPREAGCVSQHALGQTPSPPSACWDTPPDGHCSGRYASYWNAFSLYFKFTFKTIDAALLNFIAEVNKSHDDIMTIFDQNKVRNTQFPLCTNLKKICIHPFTIKI